MLLWDEWSTPVPKLVACWRLLESSNIPPSRFTTLVVVLPALLDEISVLSLSRCICSGVMRFVFCVAPSVCLLPPWRYRARFKSFISSSGSLPELGMFENGFFSEGELEGGESEVWMEIWGMMGGTPPMLNRGCGLSVGEGTWSRPISSLRRRR